MEMISYQHKLKAEFPLDSLQYEEKLGEVTDPIRNWLEETGHVATETGLYLGTTNAGIYESVAFWQNALVQSPRFANPAGFNWTLSNGPAGFLSRNLQIKGPCYTIIGSSQAIKGCFFHAFEDLQTGIAANVIVSGLDIYDGKLHFCACLLNSSPGRPLPDLPSIWSFAGQEKYAFSSLTRILNLIT